MKDLYIVSKAMLLVIYEKIQSDILAMHFLVFI